MALTTCLDCGHEVSSEALSCPNCGKPWPGRPRTPVPGTQSQPRVPGYNGMAIAALVTGILSLLCLQLLGIAAVITGLIALSQLNRQRSEGVAEEQGRAMAIAGIVTGGLAIFIGIVILIWVVAAI